MDREKLYEKVKECKKNGDSLGVIAVKCFEGDVRLFDLDKYGIPMIDKDEDW